MISKELLREVLDTYIEHVSTDTSDGYIEFEGHLDKCRINIYELAHKCKEWASKSNLDILSWYDVMEEKVAIAKILQTCEEFNNSNVAFSAYNEPEAIFKACQWILDNKEQ